VCAARFTWMLGVSRDWPTFCRG